MTERLGVILSLLLVFASVTFIGFIVSRTGGDDTHSPSIKRPAPACSCGCPSCPCDSGCQCGGNCNCDSCPCVRPRSNGPLFITPNDLRRIVEPVK